METDTDDLDLILKKSKEVISDFIDVCQKTCREHHFTDRVFSMSVIGHLFAGFVLAEYTANGKKGLDSLLEAVSGIVSVYFKEANSTVAFGVLMKNSPKGRKKPSR